MSTTTQPICNDEVFWSALRDYSLNRKPIKPYIVEWAKNWPDKAIQLAVTTNSRVIDAEPSILDSIRTGSVNVNMVSNYCNRSLKGRWPELEALLLSSPCEKHQSMMVNYASHVIGGRWIDCEKHITYPEHILEYARIVIKDRWKEKENLILEDPKLVHNYCLWVLRRERWKEGEEVLLSKDHDNKLDNLCSYAINIIGGRWKEAENLIKNDACAAYNYALLVINGRWEEAEPCLAKNPRWAFAYAQEVLKGAFPLAEKTLLSSDSYFEYFSFSTLSTRDLVKKLANQFDPNMTIAEVLNKVNDGRNKDFENKLLNSTHNQKKAVWYATNVLKSRWIEAESIIKRSAKWSVVYARDVIKGRWEDAEKIISKDPKYLAQYGMEVIKGQLPMVLHNTLVAEKLKGNEQKIINNYFDMLNSND